MLPIYVDSRRTLLLSSLRAYLIYSFSVILPKLLICWCSKSFVTYLYLYWKLDIKKWEMMIYINQIATYLHFIDNLRAHKILLLGFHTVKVSRLDFYTPSFFTKQMIETGFPIGGKYKGSIEVCTQKSKLSIKHRWFSLLQRSCYDDTNS